MDIEQYNSSNYEIDDQLQRLLEFNDLLTKLGFVNSKASNQKTHRI